MDSELQFSDSMDEAIYYCKQADSLHELGDLDRAIELCDLAISINVNLADAYNLRGIIFEEMGFYRKAEQDYKRAIKVDPEFEEARDNLCDLQTKLGDEDDVITIASFSTPTEAHFQKSRLESSGIAAFVEETSWHNSIGFGGVRLKVAESYAEQALAIINSQEESTTDKSSATRTAEYFCTKCGRDVEKDWKYCPYCADSLEEFADAEKNYEYICQYCGAHVSDQWEVCPHCGSQLIQIVGYKCAKCGFDVEKDWKYCPKCGDSLEEIEE